MLCIVITVFHSVFPPVRQYWVQYNTSTGSCRPWDGFKDTPPLMTRSPPANIKNIYSFHYLAHISSYSIDCPPFNNFMSSILKYTISDIISSRKFKISSVIFSTPTYNGSVFFPLTQLPGYYWATFRSYSFKNNANFI